MFFECLAGSAFSVGLLCSSHLSQAKLSHSYNIVIKAYKINNVQCRIHENFWASNRFGHPKNEPRQSSSTPQKFLSPTRHGVTRVESTNRLKWQSMSIFVFDGHNLLELIRKTSNWQQIYKQTSYTFYTTNDVSKTCWGEKIYIITRTFLKKSFEVYTSVKGLFNYFLQNNLSIALMLLKSLNIRQHF